MSHLRKVDHITYACAKGTIEKWAWFHIEVEGGTLINRIDDVLPQDPDSSMKIWCFDYGDFGIALVEGIDRAKKSHVTRFVERHGDHSCQHVAYDCHDLARFREHLLKNGGHPRGAVLVRHDGFGRVDVCPRCGTSEPLRAVSDRVMSGVALADLLVDLIASSETCPR